MAEVESGIEQDNAIEDPEIPEQWAVSAATLISRLIRPTRKSKRQAEPALVTVNTMERRINKGIKNK